ncbi:MAG: hypothetical protein VYB54_15900 [Pseudomonadota bacterium]|nr:hypothetical protein [Pseudomonadota bacterium]
MRWLVLFAVLVAGLAVHAGELPRKVIAFHHPNDDEMRFHPLHTLAEMPLNWLGLEMENRSTDEPFPEEAITDPEVAGVITWFEQNAMSRPLEYLDWAERMVDAGKTFVIFGDFGFLSDAQGNEVDRRRVNRFLNKLGIGIGSDWTDVTFDTRIVYRDPDMYDFERTMGGKLPAYETYTPASPDTVTHLKVRRMADGSESHLMMTSPNAGFVESFWTHYKDPVFFKTQWYVNPFAFFRKIFRTDSRPKPDVTTLSGRRMYFSHIDGDGWRNVSLVEDYRKDLVYSSRVILERAIAPYPDLPITVGPIVADLDPAWSGTEKAQQIAREIFALPQVEAAHHTWSHPFEWAFFEDYTPEKEAAFLRFYNIHEPSPWGRVGKGGGDVAYNLKAAYDQPRGFGSEPFDLDKEFGPAADYVQQFLPAGKRVELVLWSGNTSPTPRMIKASRDAGLLNINGGDARYDPEYPSLSYVPPVGRMNGGQMQIFAAASNENTYTDLWSDRFYGFRDLIHTLRNTEKPRRLKPVNVYYHMYTGEKEASLAALIGILDWARSQRLTPVTTSRYVRIAEGFYSTRFDQVGERHWRVLDRGALQTVRYDHAADLVVDMASAKGVLGFTHVQNSIYVALDASVKVPEFRLVPAAQIVRQPRPYLVDARWDIRNLKLAGGGAAFEAQGFGAGEMQWRGFAPGRWRVEASRNGTVLVARDVTTGPDGLLTATLEADAVEPLLVTIRPGGEG